MGRFAFASLIVVALAAPASAELLTLSGEVQTGGMYGKGTSGDQKDNGFFAIAPHFLYGANLAAELLFFDVWIQHQQFTEFSGTLATWTQFGVGVHHVFDLGTEPQKKLHKGNFFEAGLGFFFGIGTPIQAKLPLSNDQLSDKGFSAEVRFGYGVHLNPVLDLALAVPASYGWFTKPNQTGCSANMLSCDYQSFQIEALVVLRANLRLF